MRDAGELWGRRDVLQLFRAEGESLSFISPLVATYRRQNAGEMDLSLHRVADDTAVEASEALLLESIRGSD